MTNDSCVPRKAGFNRAALAARKGRAAIPLRAPAAIVPATAAQRQFWLAAEENAGSGAYELRAGFRISGPLDVQALSGAVKALTRRHAILRTTLELEESGTVLQKIHADVQAFQQDAGAGQTVALDPVKGPVFAVDLCRAAADDHALWLRLHHAMGDAVTVSMLLEELSCDYALLTAGKQVDSSPAQPDFADYSVHSAGAGLAGNAVQEATAHLLGAPSLLALPADYPRPSRQDGKGAQVTRQFAGGETLFIYCKSRGVTPFMVLLAAWSLCLSRRAGQEEIVLGVPMDLRDPSSTARLPGPLVNPVALRLSPARAASFDDLILMVRDELITAQEHRHAPFADVVAQLAPRRSAAHAPVFQVLASYQERPAETAFCIAGCRVSAIAAARDTAQLDLSLDIVNQGAGGLLLSLEYATSLYSDTTAVQLLQDTMHLVSEALADPASLPKAAPPALTGPKAAWDGHQRIHEAILAHAQSRPDDVAVVFEGKVLTYGGLVSRARKLARYLRRKGVAADSIVAVGLQPGLDFPVAVLAVLEAGGAYLPYDPAAPRKRLQQIFEEASPVLTIGSTPGQEDTLDPAADAAKWSGLPDAPLEPVSGAGNAAYVIYTSGSTGAPKGVVVTHANLLAMRAAWQAEYALSAEDIHLQLAPLSFDVASADLFRALTFKGRLVVASAGTRKDPVAILNLIRKEKITVADFVPAMMDAVSLLAEREGQQLADMRVLLCGSDLWNASGAQRLRRVTSDRCRIFHAYGLTETTIDALSWELTSQVTELPLGRPMANVAVRIEDGSGAEVPKGGIGELLIGGPTVARGYHRQPGLTETRFVLRNGERFYRTGDMARISAQDLIFFEGRADTQIKVAGYRIEPGEIEARLCEAGALSAAVVARKDLLIGYAVGLQADPAEVRRNLADTLPAYMIPAKILPLDRLPLTPNGKIDRKALAGRSLETPAAQATGPKRALTAIESRISGHWSALLGPQPTGPQDDFFEAGGHSMLAVRLALALSQEFGCDIRSTDILAAPVLCDMAGVIDTRTRDDRLPAIARVDRRGQDLPLTRAQQQMWLTLQEDGAGPAYNMPMALRMRGSLDTDALRQALNCIARRHDGLRSRFRWSRNKPVQSVIEAVEFELVPEIAGCEGELSRILEAEARAPFDLETGPPIRARLLQLGKDCFDLLVTVHHIAFDGWSAGVFWQELAVHYNAAVRGEDTQLPDAGAAPADYAVWQEACLDTELLEDQSEYWLQLLKDAPAVLTLPTDAARAAKRDFRGSTAPVQVQGATVPGLRSLGRHAKGTLFAPVLAAWALVLGRMAGQGSVVIGVPDAGRERAELRGSIGFFVNTLAIRVDLDRADTFADLVHQVVQRTNDARLNSDLPFEEIVQRLAPPRLPGTTPVFQAMLAWEEGMQGQAPAFDQLSTEARDLPRSSAKFDMLLALSPGPDDEITGAVEYASSLFGAATANRLAAQLEHVLQTVAREEGQAVRLCELGTESPQQAQQKAECSDGGPSACYRPAWARIEASLAETGAAPALEMQGRALSGRGLLDRVAQIASWLCDSGVGPGDSVAITVPRSFDMIASVLAVIRAGAVCVPVDPAYPKARQDVILADACAKVCIDTASLTAMSAACGDVSGARPNPEDPAYVLYTSGSTGRPKGVEQSHGMLSNLIEWQNSEQAQGVSSPQRVLQFASLNFDVAFQEIFATLSSGGTLVLVHEETRRDPAALASLLCKSAIDRAYLPFAVLQNMANATRDLSFQGHCEVITAGEALVVTEALKALLKKLGGARLCNQYGPTETHVVTQHILSLASMDDWPEEPPVGTPIAGAKLEIRDGQGALVPFGAAGELWVAGDLVANGYRGRQDLTAQRFDRHDGRRRYRTGDIVRWAEDGTLRYLGRADRQVKIRGFRVEPGEVEAALLSLDTIEAAAVMALPGTSGEMALHAHFAGTGDAPEIRDQLASSLPAHLVPLCWKQHDTLPLTANGKVDRSALAGAEVLSGRAADVAATEEEQALIEVWERVLGVSPITALDDFFALGGHSLMAARLVHEVNAELGTSLSLTQLLSTPVLRDLARTLDLEQIQPDDTLPERGIADAPQDRYAPFPLTDIQQAYWVGRHSDLGLGGVGAHAYDEILVKGLDVSRLEAALNTLVARHEMLRVVFTADGQQKILQEVPPYKMAVRDLRAADNQTRGQTLELVRSEMSHQLFDAQKWPLFDFAVTLLDEDTAHFHMSMDALVVDAASSDIFARELIALYADADADLPPIDVSFRDYVITERSLRDSKGYALALDYWLNRIEDLAPGPDLPLACRPETIEEPRFNRREAELGAEHWARLKEQASRHHVTPSTLLLAAYGRVLANWSKTPRFTLSLPLFNRRPLHPHIDRVIGDFTSVLPVEVAAGDAADFAELTRNLQNRLWADMDNSEVSGIRVVREMARLRGVGDAPFPVVFNSTLIAQNAGKTESTAPNFRSELQAERVETITQTPQVWIDHTILETSGGGILFNWDSIDELFPAGMMDEMFGQYLHLLNHLSRAEAWSEPLKSSRAAPAQPMAAPWTLETLHQRVFDQSDRAPQATAIIAPGRELTYSALADEARAVAGLLKAEGVTAGDRVAVILAPGWRQPVAALGVLACGAAYVPIDPQWPEARIADIIARTDARIAIVEDGLQTFAGAARGLPISEKILSGAPRAAVRTGAETDLAYIIFTSGSTGAPKGVAIDHGGAANTLKDIEERIALRPPDRVLAVSSLSFDLSVFDIFGTLAAGAAIVIPEADRVKDPQHWLDLVQQHNVSLWNSVPALLQLALETAESENRRMPASLRMAMLSGDWIPLTLPGKLKAHVPTASVLGMGGATEASIWSIQYPVTGIAPEWDSIPYGTALQGQQMHVLDADLRERPVWAVGEICISGRGLALGYWGDDARTRESFVQDPDTGRRFYRTGDLGRWRSDGQMEFLGRADTQVKINGYRIELGEVEAALERYEGVSSAVTRVWGAAHEKKMLAAYVTGGQPLQETEIKSFLTKHLPGYAIPSRIVAMDSLPLSANGKVDRKALPKPPASGAAARNPAGRAQDQQNEARLCTLVEGFLDVPVEADTNFLTLGATSIDIVRICNAISAELSFRPPLAKVMRNPSVSTILEIWREVCDDLKTPPGEEPPSSSGPGIDVIEDAEDAAAFKTREAGLITPPAGAERHSFAGCVEAEINRENAAARRFSPHPVPAECLGRLLGRLGRYDGDDAPRYQYGSAGGLYPVRTYLWLKPGRVEGCDAGAWVYDARHHDLIKRTGAGALDADAYDWFVNRPTFESAAFAVFFVSEDAAGVPVYGDRARDFARVEAGGMGHHLTAGAAALGLGLCGIGKVDEQAVRSAFSLAPTEHLVYSMLGGLRMPAKGEEQLETEVFEI